MHGCMYELCVGVYAYMGLYVYTDARGSRYNILKVPIILIELSAELKMASDEIH